MLGGEVAERTNATVLKTVEAQASGGSNPPLSAFVMSQDICKTRTPGVRVLLLFEAWLVADVGVEGEGSEEFPGVGRDDADVDVVDEQDDGGSFVGSADADVVHAAAAAE